MRYVHNGLDLAAARQTGRSIAAAQLPSGAIPWFAGGQIDPWDHTEAAMGLDVPITFGHKIELFIGYNPDLETNAEIGRKLRAAGVRALAVNYPIPGAPLYTADNLKYYQQDKVNLKTLTYDNLLMLEEGHCFRGQVENLCSSKGKKMHHQLNYQSGSFETLKAMVDKNYGYTLIPELSVNVNNKHVKHFTSPEPVREVSLAVHNGFVKEMLLIKLREAILKSIPSHFKKNEKYMRVRWN